MWTAMIPPMGTSRFPLNKYFSAGLLVLATRISIAQESSLDEVVVSATRRDTQLLQTPMSITALTSEVLRDSGADAFSDFARQVPGLTAIDSGPGNKRYALRGLQSAGEPEVALFYDEIPIRGLPGFSLDTGDSQPDFKLWDVERIEVLRGPQGTLYGNGSMGGALRVISKRPDLERFGAVAEEEGAYTEGGKPSWRVNGTLNAPLVDDRLGIRLAAYYRHEGGWIDTPYRADIAVPQFSGENLNTEETWGGRLSATFKASETWTLTAIAYYQDLETASAFETYPAYVTGDDRYVAKTYARTPWVDKSHMLNLISTSELGWATFTATGSYQKRALDRSTDTTRFLLSQFHCTELTWSKTCFGPSILPADAFSFEQVSASSAEMRLVSTQSGKLQWTVGGFLQRSSTDRRGQVAKVDSDGFIEFNEQTGNALNRLFARSNYDTFDQYAVYGEGTYAIRPALAATIGLRWFESDRSDQQTIVQQFFPGQPVGEEPHQQFGQNAVFKKFELAYTLSPDALLYVLASQGFRAGGPNYPGGFTDRAPPYGADSVWDYEVGWKSAFANRRASLTASVFRIDWSHLQQLVPMALFSYIANAGAARSEGFELELSALLREGLTLGLNAAYNDARLVGPQPLQTDPTAQLHDGDPLANVPKWTTAANLTYARRLGDQWSLRARLDGSYQSGRGSLVARQNPAFFQIPGAAIANVNIAFERNDRWRVSLGVENLFDRFIAQSAKALDSNLVETVTAARPRTTSLGVGLTF
jgi:outer membrane receptor protein involved in Fe transport